MRKKTPKTAFYAQKFYYLPSQYLFMRKNLLPEIVFASADSKVSQQISKLLREGYLRRLLPRVYTSNLTDAGADIVRRNLWMLLSHLFPGALLSHRSALEFQPSPEGNIFLTGKNRRTYHWPGLTIRMINGPGPIKDDPPVFESLYASSLERACLENLSASRLVDGERRTLGQGEVEERLLLILTTRGEKELNNLRDRARAIASELGWEDEFERLNQIISSLLATNPAGILVSPLAAAKALGEPYDPERLLLFQTLIAGLKNTSFPDRPEKTNDFNRFSLMAFFESYFSNYIEGTTFEVEEAASIVFQGKFIPNRTGDTHDVLGTYQLCHDRFEMSRAPHSGDEFLQILSERHRIILKGRPDKNPGAFKAKANRAGSSFFVAPEQVKGTLKKGFDMMQALEAPVARAIFMMFLISEVHPFDDGNGRLARIMMNAELVRPGQSKILIPTVFREDYILNLKKLTRNRQPEGYIRMMDRAHAFSHWLEPLNFDALFKQLRDANAFEDSDRAVLIFPAS